MFLLHPLGADAELPHLPLPTARLAAASPMLPAMPAKPPGGPGTAQSRGSGDPTPIPGLQAPPVRSSRHATSTPSASLAEVLLAGCSRASSAGSKGVICAAADRTRLRRARRWVALSALPTRPRARRRVLQRSPTVTYTHYGAPPKSRHCSRANATPTSRACLQNRACQCASSRIGSPASATPSSPVKLRYSSTTGIPSVARHSTAPARWPWPSQGPGRPDLR